MNAEKKWLGVEIGGTKLQLVVSNVAGTFEHQFRHTVDPGAGAAGIQAQIEESLRTLGAAAIAAAGVGFGGPVDWQTGVVQTSHQVAGWAGFPIKTWLEQLIQAPVAVDNDANVAALAEALHGCGRGNDLVFYMTVGSGIGGGFVKGGQIYHGASPGEVEIGHIRLTKEGHTLESECAGWAVNKIVKTFITENPHSLLAQLAAKNNTPEAALLKPALEKKDAAAQQILERIADDLSFALSHVVHLFHPDVVVLGGGLPLLGEWLRVPVAQRLPAYVMKAFHPVPPVAIATLQEAVVPIGAVELARQLYFNTQKQNA